MPWWVWILAGLVLLALELATGTLYLLFLGLSAVAVGFLAAAGLGPAWVHWLAFSFISIVSMLVVRRPLMSRLKVHDDPRDIDRLVGETALPLEEIAAGAIGRAELRGSSWSAKNVGPAPLARGERCTVERVEGLMLWLRGQEPPAAPGGNA